MISIKTITTTTAFVLALSGCAFAQSSRSGGVIRSSGGVNDTVPSAVNRVPSTVDRVPSAVDAAPSAVEAAGSSNTTTRSRSRPGGYGTLER